MLKLLLKRLLVGLLCTLVILPLAIVVSAADGPTKEGPVRTDCIECHEGVVTHWEQSDHGQASSNKVFVDAWESEGSPDHCLSCHTTNFDSETGTWEADGISCMVCHSGQSGPHPETAMPTDPSTRLCGTCHTDTYDQFEVSAHNAGALVCVRCHNPHTTDLRTGAMEDLCIDCHNEESHYYNFTAHAQEGLSCNDCHLRISDSDMGEGHSRRQHTFEVDLVTCTECHGVSMHFPSVDPDGDTQAMMWTAFGETEESATNTPTPLSNEPDPTLPQPINYLLVAAVGMGFGIAITPWAESRFRQIKAKRQGSSDGK